jgi:hypothetical protein
MSIAVHEFMVNIAMQTDLTAPSENLGILGYEIYVFGALIIGLMLMIMVLLREITLERRAASATSTNNTAALLVAVKDFQGAIEKIDERHDNSLDANTAKIAAVGIQLSTELKAAIDRSVEHHIENKMTLLKVADTTAATLKTVTDTDLKLETNFQAVIARLVTLQDQWNEHTVNFQRTINGIATDVIAMAKAAGRNPLDMIGEPSEPAPVAPSPTGGESPETKVSEAVK